MRLEPEAGDVVMGETDIVVEGAREPVRANLLNREGIVNLTATKTHHDAGRVFWSRSGDFRP